MHREILNWMVETKKDHPELFKNKRVLEIGSLNINGSVRQYFENCEYIGIDAKDGKDVDWWGIAHEYNEKPFGYFDVVISTETLEHDPFWRLTLLHMINMIHMRGSLMLSFAGPGRGAHGVQYYKDPNNPKVIRSEYHPLGPEGDYYWNIRPEMFFYELFNYIGFEHIEWNAYRRGADLCVLAMHKYRQAPNYYQRGLIPILKKHDKTKL